MGIKNLHTFLRKSFPNIYEPLHISEYAYCKIAIDVSLFLCKFKASNGPDWLTSFVELIDCLRSNEVHPVFVFDNTPPIEKTNERNRRVSQREKSKTFVSELEAAYDHFRQTGEIKPVIRSFYASRDKNPSLSTSRRSTEGFINMDIVLGMIQKVRKQIIQIDESDYAALRNLFAVLKIPYFLAPSEAETCCSDLCKREMVDAVLTEDTDVLAYAVPVFLFKLNIHDGTCMRLKYADLAAESGMGESQLRDFMICCGCDYNKNIDLIGPSKSFQLIAKTGSIEGMQASGINVDSLNHVRVRELFTTYARIDVEHVDFCSTDIDLDCANRFFAEKKIPTALVERTIAHFTINEHIIVKPRLSEPQNIVWVENPLFLRSFSISHSS
jgi:5'-3' exonuclease